jgi:hypothetical protein
MKYWKVVLVTRNELSTNVTLKSVYADNHNEAIGIVVNDHCSEMRMW